MKIPSININQKRKQRHELSGHFVINDVIILVHIPPIYSNNISQGIDRYFYQILLRYDFNWNGVPLCYSDVSILSTRANIINDNPFLHIKVKAKILLFRPNIGQSIEGIINRISSTHVGLIVYGLFNASIPIHQLETCYSWDEFINSWKPKLDKSTSHEELKHKALTIGSTLKFRVLNAKKDAQLMAIIGGLE